MNHVEELYKELKSNYEVVKESWIVKSNNQITYGVDEKLNTFDVLVKAENRLSIMQRQQLLKDMTHVNNQLKDIRKQASI